VCMKLWTKPLIASMLAETCVAGTESPVAGTWQGRLHGLPAVTLSVKEDGQKLSGTVLFYLLRYNGHSWTVDTKHSLTLSIIDPKLKGQILFFKVSHREAHPPRTLSDPPVPFQLRLTGKNEAELERMDEGKTGKQDNPLKMRRGLIHTAADTIQ
jgi:hypothetical protein